MAQTRDVIKFDVVIVGAGPAGCTCALALKDAGLRVALLDKQSFPRDKVCGDAIPGRAIKTLKSIDPIFEAAFSAFPKKFETKSTTIIYKEKQLTFNWFGDSYTCTRTEFDQFLFSLVKNYTDTELFTDIQPEGFVTGNEDISVLLKGRDKILQTKLLIGADGAHSIVARQLTNKTLERDHHVGAVRAYYADVFSHDERTAEIYFDKRFFPSYLWVFPLPGNVANVGFGMLSSEITKRKINLKKVFYEFIEQTPVLKNKFSNSIQISELKGFGLPLGSKIPTISGTRFMLAGDAASLIDPVTGEGIGNAMLSGKLAAVQAIKCFRKNDFTAGFMKNYDDALSAAIGKELKIRYKTQRLLSRLPFLLDVIFFACKNNMLKKQLQKRL